MSARPNPTLNPSPNPPVDNAVDNAAELGISFSSSQGQHHGSFARGILCMRCAPRHPV